MKILIVGAGPFGLTAGRLLADAGHTVQLIDRRDCLGGNAVDEDREGVYVHRYGMHIFHTNDHEVWQWLQQFSEWIPYQHHVVTDTEVGILPMPFTLSLYHHLYGWRTPEMMRLMLDFFKTLEPRDGSLASFARRELGEKVYRLLVKDYTEKQWGKPCEELPDSIIKRLPIRYEWNTGYFTDRYQAMPAKGYTVLWSNIGSGLPVELNVDFLADREYWLNGQDAVIYTGPVDELWSREFGALDYRSLRFDETRGDQGCPVLNNARSDCPWTRTYDWAYLPPGKRSGASEAHILTKEYPHPYTPGQEAYYPVRTDLNLQRFRQYVTRTRQDPRLWLGGRLGTFRYYDMHQTIRAAFTLVKQLCDGLTQPEEEL